MNPLPVSSTGLSPAQSTISPQRPQTAVSTSTTSSVSSRNSALTSKDIKEIVESVGLISNELNFGTVNALNKINNRSKIKFTKEYLINLAGHPAIQYYILQKEKLFFQEIQQVENNKKYKSIDSKNIKRHEIRDKISNIIANILANGPSVIGGRFEIDNRITGITENINPIFDPGFKINFSNITVPQTLIDTCNNPRRRGGTRRYVKGSKRTKRRIN